MGTRIFVGNLAYGTSDTALRGHFESAGFDVRSARIISDRETGRSRGFGFVEIGEEDEAKRAIAELDGMELEGRRLALREAYDRPPSGGSPRDGRPARPQGRRFEGRDPVVERVGSSDARRDRVPSGDRPFRAGPPGGGPRWPDASPAPMAEDRGKGDGRRRKFEDRRAGKRRRDEDDDEYDW